MSQGPPITTPFLWETPRSSQGLSESTQHVPSARLCLGILPENDANLEHRAQPDNDAATMRKRFGPCGVHLHLHRSSP